MVKNPEQQRLKSLITKTTNNGVMRSIIIQALTEKCDQILSNQDQIIEQYEKSFINPHLIIDSAKEIKQHMEE